MLKKKLITGAAAMVAAATPVTISWSPGQPVDAGIVRLNTACASSMRCEYDPYNECSNKAYLFQPLLDYRD